MLDITIGFTVCLSLVAVLRSWGLSRDVRSLRIRLNRMEGEISNLTHRLELRTSDEQQRMRVLEDVTQGNQGQLKFLLHRIQRVEGFLKEQGYQATGEPRGTTENVSRLDLQPQRVKKGSAPRPQKKLGNYNLCAIPSASQGKPAARYVKPNQETATSRVKDMWGVGH